MATVTDLSTYRKPRAITHYAYLGDIYGTAELLNGSGWLFRADGERKATVISYKDPALVLLGRCDLADAQSIDDELHSGPAGVACSRAQEVR
jgi:hypothetical protein